MRVDVVGVTVNILAVRIVVLHGDFYLVIVCRRVNIQRLFEYALLFIEYVYVFYNTAFIVELYFVFFLTVCCL